MSLVEELRRILGCHPEVQLAALFGSHAREQAGPHSDVDLAVRAGTLARVARRELLAEIERSLGRTIDLVEVDDAPPLLRFEIALDGILLLERSPGLWADFRARAMLDWWEWRPFADQFAQAAIARLRLGVTRGPT